jgi:hypothetical protein
MPHGRHGARNGTSAKQSIETAFRLLRRAEFLRAELAMTAAELKRLLNSEETLGRVMAAWFDGGGVTSEDFVAWLAAGCPLGARTVPRRGGFRLVVDNNGEVPEPDQLLAGAP